MGGDCAEAGAGVSRRVEFDNPAAAATLYAADEAALNECLVKPVVCVVGAFDGVHLGHRSLLDRGLAEAARRGASCVVVMFNPDPAKVVSPSAEPADLLAPDARRQIIQHETGAAVLVVDFTPELARLPYDVFVNDVLLAAFDLRCICVGSNFRLGAKGAGDVAALRELGARRGFDVCAVDLATSGGQPVSATRVRGLLREGKVEEAAELLGRPHTVFGQVIHGRGEGASFGFPTANVAVDASLILPREAVYAGYVTVGAAEAASDAPAQSYPAAINVGRPRSFSAQSNDAQFLEATLLGFDSNIYGSRVAVSFTGFLRDPKKFASLEELERTVLGNIDQVRRDLGEMPVAALDVLGGAARDF